MPYAVNEGPVATLTPENSVVLLVDHQLGLANWVRDQSPVEFKNAVLGLAETAKALGIPTILTTSRDFGPNGRILPELAAPVPGCPHHPPDRHDQRLPLARVSRGPRGDWTQEGHHRRRLHDDVPAVPGPGHGR